MSNQLAGNPWILDGSSLGKILINSYIHVAHFEFNDGGDSGAELVINDRSGNKVWSVSGNTTGDVLRSCRVGWINGLKETVHTTGVCYVYFE